MIVWTSPTVLGGGLVNTALGDRIRQELGTIGRTAHPPRCFGGGLFPRLRLSSLVLVYPMYV